MPSLVVGPGLVDGSAELVDSAVDLKAEAVPPPVAEAGFEEELIPGESLFAFGAELVLSAVDDLAVLAGALVMPEAGGCSSFAMTMLATVSTRFAESSLIDGCVEGPSAGIIGCNGLSEMEQEL